MRLLNLAVEGFMPYRERQTLNFQNMTLFALVGPTGSGKSALLDAITFALFGKAPRWADSKPGKALISQGKKKLTVEVQFQVKGKVYQVVRSVSSSKQEAQLRHLAENGEFRPMGKERLTPVQLTPEIEHLIGMNYATFTKTLMLPQGQFDRLLKPQKPIERKELLIQLAGLGLYDELNDRLSLRTRPLEQELYAQESQKKRFQDLDPEALQQLQDKLVERQESQKHLQQQQAEAEARVQQLQRDLQTWQNLQQVQSRLSQLEARQDQIQDLKQRLEKSQRVASQRHLLRNLDQCRQDVEESRSRWERAQSDLHQLSCQLDPLQQALAAAQKSALRIPELREQRDGLLTLQAIVQPYQEKRQNRENRLQTHRINTQALEKLQGELQGLQDELEERQRRHQSLQKDLQGASPGQVATWERALTLAQELETLSQGLKELTASLQQARLEQLPQEEQRLDRERQLQEARQKHQQLADKDRALQRDLASQNLRGQLEKDCPCPVCLQTVTQIPECSRVEQAQLDSLQKDLRAQQQEVERLDQEYRQLEKHQAAQDSQRTALEQQQERLKAELQQKQQDFQEQVGEGLDLSEIRLRLQKARDEDLQNQRWQSELRDLEEQIRQLQTRSQLRAKDLENLQQQIQSLQDELQQLDLHIAELEGRLHQELGTPTNFQAELQERVQKLQQEISQLEFRLKQAEEAHQQVFSRRQSAQGACQIYQEQHHKDLQQREQGELELAEFLTQSGIASEQQMRDWVLSAQQQAEWEQTVEEHERDRANQEAAQTRLRQELAGRQPSPEQLQEASQQVARMREDSQQHLQEIGKLKQQIQQYESELSQFQKLQDETEKTHHLLQVHKKLAGMLNANGLKAFVANRLLEEILVLASAEMERLSGRYQLTLEEDDLLVVDIWNAGERRDVRSLSGGETFLASLSLALAMIEYLSQGSPLESLFIDEGFGTLDSETLEAVTQTLEGLQAKGRLVGVITHVPELAERLPVQIRIEKSQGSSRILDESFPLRK